MGFSFSPSCSLETASAARRVREAGLIKLAVNSDSLASRRRSLQAVRAHPHASAEDGEQSAHE